MGKRLKESMAREDEMALIARSEVKPPLLAR